ncbi:MAG: alpha/beta hydrolase, partial [Paraburkholderia sp.]
MNAFKPPYSLMPSGAAEVTDAPSARTALDVTDVTIEGHAQDITLRLYRPAGKSALPVLLYFHGGGFVRGSLDH